MLKASVFPSAACGCPWAVLLCPARRQQALSSPVTESQIIPRWKGPIKTIESNSSCLACPLLPCSLITIYNEPEGLKEKMDEVSQVTMGGGHGDTCTHGPIPWRMGRGSPARRGFSVPGHSLLVSSPDLHHPPLSSGDLHRMPWHLVPPLGSCFSPQHAGFVAGFVIFLLFSFCPLFLALRHHQPFVHVRLPPSFCGSTDFPPAIYPPGHVFLG